MKAGNHIDAQDSRANAPELELQIVTTSHAVVQPVLKVASTAAAEGWSDDEGWGGPRDPFRLVQTSEDLLEHPRAFSEKRPLPRMGC